MDAYIKGQGAGATETNSTEINIDRSGDWDNTKLMRLSQCDLSPVELEQRTSTKQPITQSQLKNGVPSTWDQAPWSSFNPRTSFQPFPPFEKHPQNFRTSYDEPVPAYHFDECLDTNYFYPFKPLYNTTESLKADNSIHSAYSEASCWNQPMDLIPFGSNDVRKNDFSKFSPWPEPQPHIISLLDD